MTVPPGSSTKTGSLPDRPQTDQSEQSGVFLWLDECIGTEVNV